MTSPVPFGKYSSLPTRWGGDRPPWVPPAHEARVRAYQAYNEIYWSHVATTYKIMNRGLDLADEPLYVPSSRVMINTLDRYIGKGLTFQVDPATGTPERRLAIEQAFTNLFARERFHSRYAAAKREGLIKGDWLWHITADLEKEAGKRLTLMPVKPEHYFPTFEDEVVEGGDPDRLAQVRLVEPYQEGDQLRVRIQLYDRTVDEAGTIYSSLQVWKAEDWYDPDKSMLEELAPPRPLPSQITAFPVYHVPNGYEPGEVFGTSEMRGLETLQAALNQTATDEDLTLALSGLGVYATDENAGKPLDSSGNPTDWFISPGAVLEGASGLRRVPGVTSLTPYTEHVERLEGYMGDATGATDAARGRMEVQEAESGVALELRLGPTLAHAATRDQVILDVHNQMFYDLVQMWFPLDGITVTEVTVTAKLGDKLPINRKAEVQMVNELVLGGILSAASGRMYLLKKGFNDLFQEAEGDLILAEKAAFAAAEMGGGGLGAREDEELTDADDA